jgi:hypothetical protein
MGIPKCSVGGICQISASVLHSLQSPYWEVEPGCYFLFPEQVKVCVLKGVCIVQIQTGLVSAFSMVAEYPRVFRTHSMLNPASPAGDWTPPSCSRASILHDFHIPWLSEAGAPGLSFFSSHSTYLELHVQESALPKGLDLYCWFVFFLVPGYIRYSVFMVVSWGLAIRFCQIPIPEARGSSSRDG